MSGFATSLTEREAGFSSFLSFSSAAAILLGVAVHGLSNQLTNQPTNQGSLP
jgi:hypothetical protein